MSDQGHAGSSPRLVAGIDGGGTRTRAAIADAAGRLLGRGEAGPGNPAKVGPGAALAAIAEALRAAVAEARAGRLAVVAACLAGASRAPADFLADLHARIGVPVLDTFLRTDLEAAYAGALGARPGVVVIGGTGSSALARRDDGACVRAGGLGHLAGDEGSGFWIAVEAVRRGLGGREDPDGALRRLQAAGFDAGLVEGLTRGVVAAAERGGDGACALLAEAGSRLADLAVLALESAGSAATSPAVVSWQGSVIGSPFVLPAFMERMALLRPRSVITAPEGPPVAGACRLAIERLTGSFPAMPDASAFGTPPAG